MTHLDIDTLLAGLCREALRARVGVALIPRKLPGRPTISETLEHISWIMREYRLPLESFTSGGRVYLIHAHPPTHSNPRLRRIFRNLNQRYFGGRVSKETRLVWRMGRSEHIGEYAPCVGGRPLIAIHPYLARLGQGRSLYDTLAHEMVHAVTWQGSRAEHGTRFQVEERRLGRLGALHPTHQRTRRKVRVMMLDIHELRAVSNIWPALPR